MKAWEMSIPHLLRRREAAICCRGKSMAISQQKKKEDVIYLPGGSMAIYKLPSTCMEEGWHDAWSSAICSKGRWMTTLHLLKRKEGTIDPKSRGCHPSEREEGAIYLKGGRMSATFNRTSMAISNLLKRKEDGIY